MKKYTKFAAYMMALSMAAFGFASCGDDEDDPVNVDDTSTEVADLTGIKAVGNSDGTITIKGTLKANKKIKELVLIPCNADGTINSSAETVDLFSKGDEQLKSKGEDGKSFEAPIPETNVPVQIYRLRIKVGTGNKGKDSVTIGRSYSFTVGNKDCTTKGSYVSLVNGQSYMLSDISTGTNATDRVFDESKCKNIEIVYSSGQDITAAQNADNEKFAAVSGHAKVYASSKTIMTNTGCIATYNFVENSGDNTAELSGIVIDSKTVEVETNVD